MIVNRVERIIIKDKNLDNLCYLTKNLYNYANYLVRQEFITTSIEKEEGLRDYAIWLQYHELYEQVKNTVDYKALPAQTAQQVLRLLDKNWKSFFQSIKDYKKYLDKYKGVPKLPQYKKKNGRQIAIFTNQQCTIKDGYLIFPKFLNKLKIKTTVSNFQQVRIVPKMSCFIIEIIYKKEVEQDTELEFDKVLGIDLGINNFATCCNNIGKQPFIVNGRIIKANNQYFNKRKAELVSKLTKGKETKEFLSTKRLDRLSLSRENKILDYMHKASTMIISYARRHKIGTIVIGDFSSAKQNCNIGKRNNQKFISIPHYKFVNQIKYKAEEIGMRVLLGNEAYTSKCSFLDLESIEKHTAYLGKRISRGMFRASNGQTINADCNGAYNIIRKVIPEAFVKGIEGIGLFPVMINPYKQSLLNTFNVN